MVRQPRKLKAFETHLLKREKLSYREALRIFNALYQEALHLKSFSRKNTLQGLHHTLRIAKFLNARG